jgi:hypothetical protein
VPKQAYALPALLAAALLFLAGCGGAAPETAAKGGPAAGRPLYSYAQMNDLRVAPQLGMGFYAIEEGGWRWMAKEARLMLRAPDGASPQFEVRFTLPKGQVQSLGPMTLSILFNDKPFASMSYPADGDYTLTKDVPPGTLTPAPVHVTLRWDKARPPDTAGDARELGAVIVGVGFK